MSKIDRIWITTPTPTIIRVGNDSGHQQANFENNEVGRYLLNEFLKNFLLEGEES